MGMDQQLKDYITQSRQVEKTNDKIRQELLGLGWDVAQVEEALKDSPANPKSYKKLIKILVIVAIITSSVIGGYAALGKYLPQYAKYVRPYLGPVLDKIVGNIVELPTDTKDNYLETNKPEKFGQNLIKICHHASANITNWHEIDVASPSVELNGHLTHGDTIGSCTSPIPTPAPKIPNPNQGHIISCNKNPAPEAGILEVDQRKIEDIKCLRDAIIKYYEDHDNYPVSFELDKSLGTYFPDGVPKDPVFRRNYYYAYRSTIKSPTKAFQIWAELEKYNPALESDSDFDSFHARDWLGAILDPNDYGSEKCVRANPRGPDPLKEDLSRGSLMPDCAYDLKVDGHIPSSSGPICAVYLGQGDPLVFLKGPWTDDRRYTSSKDNCLKYAQDNILNQPYCGQPDSLVYRVLLLPGAKSHTYTMLPYGEAEYVSNGFCPNSNNI